MSKENDLPFIEHLEELRWHLIRAVAAVLIFMVLAFTVGKEFIFKELILGVSRTDFPTYRFFCWLSETTCIDKIAFTIQNRTMTGQFTMHLMVSTVAGFLAAFPYIFWEIWRFISPGLHSNERNAASGVTFFVSLLFFMGVLFGYYVITPLSINFLSNYQVDPSIINEIDLTSYISTILMLTLFSGLMFELPMIIYFLSVAGIVNPEIMQRFRRHSVVVILIIAAIITPPDVISQVLISIPVYALYELSILISAWVWRKKEKAAAAAAKKAQEEEEAEIERSKKENDENLTSI